MLKQTKSRVCNDRTERRLNPQSFHELLKKGRAPAIGLFAWRQNFKIKPFISWRPDLEWFTANACTVNWNRWVIFVFPPFRLSQKTRRKLEEERRKAWWLSHTGQQRCGTLRCWTCWSRDLSYYQKESISPAVTHRCCSSSLPKATSSGRVAVGEPWGKRLSWKGSWHLVRFLETRTKNNTPRTSQDEHVSVLGGIVIHFDPLQSCCWNSWQNYLMKG